MAISSEQMRSAISAWAPRLVDAILRINNAFERLAYQEKLKNHRHFDLGNYVKIDQFS